MSVYRVFACESQPVALVGLIKILSETEDLVLQGSAATTAEAVSAISESRPDIVVVDQGANLRQTFSFLSELKMASPASRIVLWVAEMSEVEGFRALQLGARGIIRRTLGVESLLECLRTVAKGSLWLESTINEQVVGLLNRRPSTRLTPREKEIVKLICRGMKNKEIADYLYITPGTVKVHLMHIFEKTGVKDRFELAMQGNRLLGVEPEETDVRATLPNPIS